VGPLPGGTDTVDPADFGTIPEACPRSDLALRLRGEIWDGSAAPDFQGRLIVGATARARLRLGARSTVSIALDFVTVRYVNDAGLATTAASFGPATAGYELLLAATERTAVAAYARVLLPVDTSRSSDSTQTGLELGGAGRARLSARWAADGGLALVAPLVITAGVAHGHLQPAALAELWFSPTPRFGLFGGAALRAEVAPAAELVAVTPRVGLRAALRHGIWLAFLAEAPLGGSDRTNAVAGLFVGWTPAAP
jgi:hypothetical protein